MKKTPWFPASIKPVRIGFYQVKDCIGFLDCSGYHYWDGEKWLYQWGKIKLVAPVALPWRGLSKPCA